MFLDDRMTFFSLSKLNKKRSNWTVLALTVCLNLIALFGSPFHNHDLDSSSLDLDCIACQLVNSNDALGTDTPELSFSTLGTRWIWATATVWIASAPLTASSRAPPVIC